MDILAKGIATNRIRQIENNTYRAFDPWDSNPLMADKPMRLQVEWMVENEEALELANRLFVQFIKGRRQRAHGIVLVWMNVIVATLHYANLHNQQVLYSRDNTRGTLVKEIVDWLADRRWVDTFIAPQQIDGGCTSWMIPTKKFNYHIARTGVVIGLRKGYTFVEKRGDPEKKGGIKPVVERNTDRYNGRLGKGATAYNEFILDTMFTLDGKLLIPFFKRIFSKDSYRLGGRFYSALQSLPKVDRERMLIELSAVAEPDFSGYHPRMVYAEAGIQFPLDVHPYSIIDGYDSDKEIKLIKKLSNKWLNANSEGEFKSGVSLSGYPKMKEEVQEWGVKFSRYNKDLRLYREGIISKKPTKPKMTYEKRGRLSAFIEGVPDGLDGGEILEKLKAAHKPILPYVCKPNTGLKLQFKDSQIMDQILKETTKRKIPVAPVHDSCICKESDKAEVEEIMLRAYFDKTKYHAKIG